MGWPVFPSTPDKRPLCAHGHNDATLISSAIEDWSKQFPQANIGLQTGNTICVVDIDGEDGEASIASLSQWCPLPPTAEARSGRGRHLYYRAFPVRSAKLGKGIDLKARGGSITAPISLHKSGKLYEWITPPFGMNLPTLPLWIIHALKPPKPRWTQTYNRPDLDRFLSEIRNAPQGERNHTLNRIAFILGKCGMENVLEAIIQAGREAGLSLPEARATARSGFNSGLRQSTK